MIYISRVTTKNYRRFWDVDIPFKPHTVVIGENNSGKTSLLYLLDTLLNPSRRFAALDDADVSYGFDSETTCIEAIIEMSPLGSPVFTTEERVQLDPLIDVLPDGHEKLLLKLEHKFDSAEGAFRSRARFVKTDGKEVGPFTARSRKLLAFFVIQAMRSAARDLLGRGGTWARMVGGIRLEAENKKKLGEIAANAASEVLSLMLGETAFAETSSRFQDLLSAVLWTEAQPGELTFSMLPSEQRELLQAIQILVKNPGDVQSGGILEHGDGTQSVAVVALMLAYVEALGYGNASIAVEELENHLHPHATRAFMRYLWNKPQQVIVTTHSSHVTDVVELDHVVLLKRRGSKTIARFVPDSYFSPQELRELSRHVHTAGSEFLFARCVLLVEGATELVALPILAKALGIDVDRAGISIVAVSGGDNFRPFIRLLQPNALDAPYLILCDKDQVTINAASTLKGLGLLTTDITPATLEANRGDLEKAGLFFLPEGAFENYLIAEGHLPEYETAIERVFGTGRLDAYTKRRIASDKSYSLRPRDKHVLEFIDKHGSKPELAYEVANVLTNEGKDSSKILPYFSAVLTVIAGMAEKESEAEHGSPAPGA